MKELYIAPELEIMGFMAEEKLAAQNVDMDELIAAGQGVSADANVDIDLPLGW